MATFGALSAYSLIGGTIKRYERIEKYSNSNLYGGIMYGVSALYYYKVLSKEEKALENFRNQP